MTCDLHRAVPIVSKLNAWARSDYGQMGEMYRAKDAVYVMKKRLILEALRAGVCQLRVVQVERPCKTCAGTGLFKRWGRYSYDSDDYDLEDCRRCQASGRVVLKFLETAILGAKWHTPRPKAGFLSHLDINWESGHDTEWVPEQPGLPLERRELIGLLNQAERSIYGKAMIRWGSWWRASVFEYSLHFGEIWDCFVCGRPAEQEWKYATAVYRPALQWGQAVCDGCRSKAERWPMQWPANLMPHHNRGKWIAELPAWPMNVPLPESARTDDVQEWLARRGIVEGRVVPGDYGYWFGDFVEVVAHVNGSTILKTEVSCNPERLIKIPANQVTARQTKCLPVLVPNTACLNRSYLTVFSNREKNSGELHTISGRSWRLIGLASEQDFIGEAKRRGDKDAEEKLRGYRIARGVQTLYFYRAEAVE